MKYLMFIIMMLIISISCYAQESQESYTLLLVDFEDRSGIENPLLAVFNDAIDFVLSRQTGPVQVRLIPKSDRDALLVRAVTMQSGKTLLEQGLLAAEWADADGLITGSYTKRGEQWSLQAQVYHRREGRKARQPIQIQGDSVYKLLDDFPAHLLKQFNASYLSLTTNSWKAYEAFRKGYQEFENYNYFGALQLYDQALELDPTLALAYAEKSHIYAMIEPPKATPAIEAAKQWLPKASPMEQLAIRALAYIWDSEKNGYREWLDMWEIYGVKHLDPMITTATVNLTPGGVWDEPLLYQLSALVAMQEGNREKADEYHALWFSAIQPRLQAHPEDVALLHQTAGYCIGIGKYIDEAIELQLRAIELETEANWREERYYLSRLYEMKGDIEGALDWAKSSIQHSPPLDSDVTYVGKDLSHLVHHIMRFHLYVWDHLGLSAREGKIPPQRLLRWCEEVLNLPDLYQGYRIRTQYLIADLYDAMGNRAKVDATLAAIGSPHESDWMVIGPFETPGGRKLFPDNPPFDELFTNLSDTHVGVFGKELKWESWEDEHPLDGYVYLWKMLNIKHYGRRNPYYFGTASIAYSCVYANLPKVAEAQMHVSFVGPGFAKIWLNEDLTPISISSSTIIPEGTPIDISLNAGLNRFLIATISGDQTGHYFRLTDREDKPIPGLEYISANEILSSH